MARSATPYRLETSVTDAPTVQKAKRLMALLQTGNADLFRGALDILDWCVRQVLEGRHIASIDDRGGMTRELSAPLLDAVRPTERMVLHTEAFDRVVEILQQPSEPTPELRELMAEAYARQRPVPA
jgi:hypothetical protein